MSSKYLSQRTELSLSKAKTNGILVHSHCEQPLCLMSTRTSPNTKKAEQHTTQTYDRNRAANWARSAGSVRASRFKICSHCSWRANETILSITVTLSSLYSRAQSSYVRQESDKKHQPPTLHEIATKVDLAVFADEPPVSKQSTATTFSLWVGHAEVAPIPNGLHMFGNCPDDFAASDSNRQLACPRHVPHFRAVTLLHAQIDCLTTAESCSELCACPASSLPHHARHLSPAPAVPPTTDSTIPMVMNDQPLIRVKYEVQSILRIPRLPNGISPPFHRKRHSVTPPDTGVSRALQDRTVARTSNTATPAKETATEPSRSSRSLLYMATVRYLDAARFRDTHTAPDV